MTYYQNLIEKYVATNNQMKCISFYLAMMSAYAIIVWLIPQNAWLLSILLFTGGWVTWTFLEYIIHRFWMHDTQSEKASPIAQYHMHHHTHPTEMDITPMHRLLVWGLVSLLVGLSFWLSLYFMILAGFVSGFSGYTLMHWVLHQRWSVKLFPRLHRFHLYHHCKYPNTCYGVSVSWWDLIFKTVPPEEPVLLKRVVDFYFHPNQKKKQPLSQS